MTEKKKPIKKTAAKRTVGAPPKYKALLTPKNWKKIEMLASCGHDRTFISKFFDVNKDTFLKALKEKGWENWEQMKQFHFQGFIGRGKAIYMKRIENKEVSDKLLMHFMDKIVLPLEEFNKKEKDDQQELKVVCLPVTSFGSEEQLQQAVINQQADTMEELAKRKAQFEKEMEEEKKI